MEPITIHRIMVEAHETATEHGFHDDNGSLEKSLLLIHSEVTEAVLELRDGKGVFEVSCRADGKPEGFRFELADIIIRVCDLAQELGFGRDFEGAIIDKMQFNKTRPHKHGKVF